MANDSNDRIITKRMDNDSKVNIPFCNDVLNVLLNLLLNKFIWMETETVQSLQIFDCNDYRKK